MSKITRLLVVLLARRQLSPTAAFARRRRCSGTVRDAHGWITAVTSVSPSGERVTRDEDGRIVGTATRSAAGTITYRDADGRITGSR